MFHFHPTLKRVIWGIRMDSNILLKSSSDVIFLNFQYFDKISKLGGWEVRIKEKNLHGAFSPHGLHYAAACNSHFKKGLNENFTLSYLA